METCFPHSTATACRSSKTSGRIDHVRKITPKRVIHLDHCGTRRIKQFISLDTVCGISRSSLHVNGIPRRVWKMCQQVSVSFLLFGWASTDSELLGTGPDSAATVIAIDARRRTSETRWKSACASNSRNSALQTKLFYLSHSHRTSLRWTACSFPTSKCNFVFSVMFKAVVLCCSDVQWSLGRSSQPSFGPSSEPRTH